MPTVHHADVVGSMLRPSYLIEAQEARQSGRLGPAEFKRIEDRAVDACIATQEGLGFRVVSDGEMRRVTFFDHLLSHLDGVAEIPGPGVQFHQPDGRPDFTFQAPITVVDKLRPRKMMTVEEYAYGRGRARVEVKVTLPSPLLLYSAWSPERSTAAYRDAFEMFADAAGIMREEAAELARMGCRYIQIDSPDLGTMVDPENRSLRESLGMPTERTLSEGIDLINSVADVAGVTFGLHLCKGNYLSQWIAKGGYDQIAESLFRRAANFEVFLLEYDDERSGSFEPLAKVPEDKAVVLGLISSKTTELEPVDALKTRIDEAARYLGKDRLGLSTQCGFASVSIGANLTSEDVQAKKLRRVVQVADEVWG